MRKTNGMISGISTLPGSFQVQANKLFLAHAARP